MILFIKLYYLFKNKIWVKNVCSFLKIDKIKQDVRGHFFDVYPILVLLTLIRQKEFSQSAARNRTLFSNEWRHHNIFWNQFLRKFYVSEFWFQSDPNTVGRDSWVYFSLSNHKRLFTANKFENKIKINLRFQDLILIS